MDFAVSRTRDLLHSVVANLRPHILKFVRYAQLHSYAKSHKVTIEEAIADSERDQVANRLGRERGRKYPNCKCDELMSDLKPKHRK